MVANERGSEGDADGFGGSPADDDLVDLLADAEEEDTAAVVERLRESGPRQHVSGESVDEVLAELDGDASGIDDGTGTDESDAGDGHADEDGDADERGSSSPDSQDQVGRESHSESDDADGEASGGLVGGGPTTTVSQEGIDEVFEKLEAETPDRGDETGAFGAGARDVSGTDDGADTGDPTDAASGTSSSGDGFGALAGGGPTTTVSDEGVDEVLSQVGDDAGYATFDGDDAPDVAAETEVDPDAVFPDDWETAEDDGGAVPEPDEHTPAEDAADLRPDDDGGLDLFADVAEEVNDAPSTAETPDEPSATADGTDVDLAETAAGLFDDESTDEDGFEEAAVTDDGPVASDAAGTDDGLDPDLADEVGALLSAADDVDSGTESEATVDSLDDAESRDGAAPASASSQGDLPDDASIPEARRDADERGSSSPRSTSSRENAAEETSSSRAQSSANDRQADESQSRLALNAPDDAGIEWSEDGAADEQSWIAPETTESVPSDAPDDGAMPEDGRAAESDRDDSPDDERSFAGLRYARAATGWLRSLLARLA